MIEILEHKQPEGISVPSATERAVNEFRERAKDISGVLAVRTLGGSDSTDQFVLVEVPDLRSTAADRIYMLHRDLFRKYPDARLDVRVSAVRHGDRTDAGLP